MGIGRIPPTKIQYHIIASSEGEFINSAKNVENELEYSSYHMYAI